MPMLQASKTISFAGALNAPTAIKTSIATVAAPASYSGGAHNGATGVGVNSVPRLVVAVLSANPGSYTNPSTITLTGTGSQGEAQTDTLTIASTGGGVTLTSAKWFLSVTQIDVAAQADTGGAFTFGYSDAYVDAVEVRTGSAGNLHIKFASGATDTIVKSGAGEHHPVLVASIFADSTAQDITIYKA